MIYLSVIIPVYNAEKYLEDCVNSILNQQFSDYEILLIDDGSTDGSAALCDRLSMENEAVKAYHVPNGGPSKARNYALKKASGVFVQFVDSDDLVEENALSAMFEKAKVSKSCAITAIADVVNQNNEAIQTLTVPDQGETTIQSVLKNLTVDSKAVYLHYLWNKWYRLDFLKQNNIYFREDVRLGEDFIFNCEMFMVAETIEGTDIPLYRYFKRNSGSLSSRFNPHELQRRRMMDSVFLKLYQEKNLYNGADKKKIEQMIGSIALASIRSVVSKNAPELKAQLNYVDSFLASEYYDFLDKYRKMGTASKADKTELFLLKNRWKFAFLIMERVRKSN